MMDNLSLDVKKQVKPTGSVLVKGKRAKRLQRREELKAYIAQKHLGADSIDDGMAETAQLTTKELHRLQSLEWRQTKHKIADLKKQRQQLKKSVASHRIRRREINKQIRDLTDSHMKAKAAPLITASMVDEN